MAKELRQGNFIMENSFVLYVISKTEKEHL